MPFLLFFFLPFQSGSTLEESVTEGEKNLFYMSRLDFLMD